MWYHELSNHFRVMAAKRHLALISPWGEAILNKRVTSVAQYPTGHRHSWVSGYK